MAAANANMRFTQTNDIVSTKYVSIDPALGLEFGYTDLVLFEQVRNFQNVQQLDNSERSVFNLILDLGFNIKAFKLIMH
jgi:hypothetical protein